MTGETLLTKAYHNYNVAVMVWNQMEGDEAYLNYVGFHLQQSVEMALKHQLEQAGIEYPKTHDIDQLIRIGKENGCGLALTDYVEDKSEMFSLWEARIRYVLNYSREYGKVERALHEVSIFLDRVQERELEKEAMDLDFDGCGR